MIIYKVTNTVKNMIYVGLTTHSLKRRKWQHLSLKYSGTTILSKAIEKYGADVFHFEIIDHTTNEIELMEKERMWIARLNTMRPNGYNVLNGNEAGRSLTRSRFVEIICVEDGVRYENMSDAARMYNVPTQSIWCVCSGRCDFAGTFSFRYTDVEKYNKAEMRRSQRQLTAKIGYDRGAQKNRKQIICIETGEVFKSIKSASVKLMIDPSQIVRVCKGVEKTAGKMTFKYFSV